MPDLYSKMNSKKQEVIFVDGNNLYQIADYDPLPKIPLHKTFNKSFALVFVDNFNY